MSIVDKSIALETVVVFGQLDNIQWIVTLLVNFLISCISVNRRCFDVIQWCILNGTFTHSDNTNNSGGINDIKIGRTRRPQYNSFEWWDDDKRRG